MGLAGVSVHLFPNAREKLLGVCRAVEQFKAETDGMRLIVMGSGLQGIGELDQLRRGRVFRKVGRRTVRGGTGGDLVAFLDAARVGLLEDEQDFYVLEFQCNVVRLGIPQVRAKHVYLLLTEAEWDKLKASPTSPLRWVFGFGQHEAFRAIYIGANSIYWEVGRTRRRISCFQMLGEFPRRGARTSEPFASCRHVVTAVLSCHVRWPLVFVGDRSRLS
jgi:hypothetical protein